MKKVPLHLFQMGGVVPIEAPLMRDTEMSPLIQVASMPVDSGVAAALQFRGQQLQRESLRLQEEQFEWQKAKWEEDFDYRVQQDKTNNILKAMDMFHKVSRNYMPTGVSASGTRATGIPGNYQNNAQMLAAYKAQDEVASLRSEFMKNFESNITSGPATNDVMTAMAEAQRSPDLMKANTQLIHYNKQAEIFKELGDKADTEIFSHRWGKYMNASTIEDLDLKENLIYDSIPTVIEKIIDANKENWGIPTPVNIGSGYGAVIQQSPDIRAVLTEYLAQDPTGTLRAKYEIQQEILAQEEIPSKLPPFEEWAAARAAHAVNAYGSSSDVKVNKIIEPAKPGEADSTDDSTGPRIFPKEQISTEEYPAIDAKVSPSIELDFDYDPVTTRAKAQKSDPLFAMTMGIVDNSPSADPKDFPILSKESEVAMNRIVRALTSNEEGEVDVSLYMDEDRRFTKEGVQLIKDYRKLWRERINQTVLVTHWDDAKADGVLNIADNSESAIEHFIATRGSKQVIDLATGDIYTGSEIVEEFGGREEFKKLADMPGIVDTRNIIPLVALSGDQRNIRLDELGAAPYYMTVEDDKGRTRNFAVRRSKGWLEANKEYTAGNKIYTDALANLGISGDVDEQALKEMVYTIDPAGHVTETLNDDGTVTTTDSREEIIKNVGISRMTKDMGGNTFVTLTYGEDSSEISDSKLIMSETQFIGQGLNFLHSVASTLGKDHNVTLQQGRSEDGTVGWTIQVDDNTPMSFLQGDENDIPIIRETLKQSIIDAQQGGGGRFNAANVFENAVYKDHPDMSLNKRFILDWNKEGDKVLPTGYAITSGFRPLDRTGRKGTTIDLSGKTGSHIKWFKDNMPYMEKTNGIEVKYYRLPGTQFAVAWHENMDIVKDPLSGKIRKIPNGTGYHYDIKYANEVQLQPSQ